MISTTLKVCTRVVIEDMAVKYELICRNMIKVFTIKFLFLFVSFDFLYNLKEKLFKYV